MWHGLSLFLFTLLAHSAARYLFASYKFITKLSNFLFSIVQTFQNESEILCEANVQGLLLGASQEASVLLLQEQSQAQTATGISYNDQS